MNRQCGLLCVALIAGSGATAFACTPKDPALIVDLPLRITGQCAYQNAGMDGYFDGYAAI